MDQTVVISEEGEVTPFMDIFDMDSDADERVVDAIKDHLGKVGRQLGSYDAGDDQVIYVIINADNSIYPVEDLVVESPNVSESLLLDIIRSALRMDHRRLGTAHIPKEYLDE